MIVTEKDTTGQQALTKTLSNQINAEHQACMQAGRKWKWMVVHVPTDHGIVEFSKKVDAMKFAGDLFEKFPDTDFWRTGDATLMNERLNLRKDWIMSKARAIQ
jgi:hypothetical protein